MVLVTNSVAAAFTSRPVPDTKNVMNAESTVRRGVACYLGPLESPVPGLSQLHGLRVLKIDMDLSSHVRGKQERRRGSGVCDPPRRSCPQLKPWSRDELPRRITLLVAFG